MAYAAAPAAYAYMMAPEYTPYTYAPAHDYEYPPRVGGVLDPSMTKRLFDGEAAMPSTKRAAPPNYHMRNMNEERQERLAAFNLQALGEALPAAEPSPMLSSLQDANLQRQQQRQASADAPVSVAASWVATPSPMQALLKEAELERQWRRQRQKAVKEKKRRGEDRMEEADVKRRASRRGSESGVWVSASDFVRAQ